MEEEIENRIEELTKVRPEMLNEEALKLFNTIMAILDERDKLRKENDILIGQNEWYKDYYDCDSVQKSKIKEKIEELNKRIEQYDEYSKQRAETDVEFYENIADTAIVQVLSELMEDK